MTLITKHVICDISKYLYITKDGHGDGFSAYIKHAKTFDSKALALGYIETTAPANRFYDIQEIIFKKA